MTRSVWSAGALALTLSVAPALDAPVFAAADSETQSATASSEAGADGPAAAALDPETEKAVTEAAIAYLDAFKAQGLGAAATHLHPDAMERFKTIVLPAFEAEQARGSRSLLNATFGREASVIDARLASPADFLSRFARLISVRQPDLAPEFESIEPIGVLPEGERSYAVLRLKSGTGADTVERIEVVSLTRDGSTWKVLLDGRLVVVARSLAGRDRRPADRRLMAPLPEGGPVGPAGGPPAPLGLPQAPEPAIPPLR